mgnify:CR=1 FL=1
MEEGKHSIRYQWVDYDQISPYLIRAVVAAEDADFMHHHGLRWDAIDFQQNTITIQHTVIACRLNGKYEVIARDTTKTKSSRRTLPLAAPIRKYLLNTIFAFVCAICLCLFDFVVRSFHLA